MSRRIRLYDTTLRDGCQGEDVSFTLTDKLRLVERLDELGFDTVEGGWPGSNPRDEEFFRSVRRLPLRRARVAAFGMTRRAGVPAANDANLRRLLEAETPVVTIFGKTWDLHVHEDLRISPEENLEVIRDSVAFLKSRTDEVVFDAEHFFDGYRAHPEYALACVRAAVDGGADVVCLCDTNGGSLPTFVGAACRDVADAVSVPLGIHCHNDAELAVANSLAGVEAGAVQVQGTINGVGERCGNANLISIIANLQIKGGFECLEPEALARLTELSHFVYELANLTPPKHQPYVGQSAFAHKGGVHVAAVRKNPRTYEHVEPGRVGNIQRILISDLAGRASILHKAEQFGLDVESRDPKIRKLLVDLKELESRGYQYEGAEASFELLMSRALGEEARFFRLIGFRAIDQKTSEADPPVSEATVMIEGPDGAIEHTAATGNGPVHALDQALRKALTKFYPEIAGVHLLDYKVRVLAGEDGTAASVRVLIESGDDEARWGTVGVSHNVIEASWRALVDSFDYKLFRMRRPKTPAAASGRRGGV